MTLSVIGAGFGRTGTLSLKLALEQLGFGPCCHGLESRHFNQDTTFWDCVFSHEEVDWDEFFHGYRSTVDSPTCKVYLKLAKKYPSAKIILTWRESNAWFDSYQETILPMAASSQGRKYLSFLFGDQALHRDSVIAAYDRHNAEVQRLIPAERLLVYEVKQGWQPLCEFLDVSVPDTPFPRTNLRNQFPSVIDGLLARLTQESTVRPIE